jgi:hypothetical protein
MPPTKKEIETLPVVSCLWCAHFMGETLIVIDSSITFTQDVYTIKLKLHETQTDDLFYKIAAITMLYSPVGFTLGNNVFKGRDPRTPVMLKVVGGTDVVFESLIFVQTARMRLGYKEYNTKNNMVYTYFDGKPEYWMQLEYKMSPAQRIHSAMITAKEAKGITDRAIEAKQQIIAAAAGEHAKAIDTAIRKAISDYAYYTEFTIPGHTSPHYPAVVDHIMNELITIGGFDVKHQTQVRGQPSTIIIDWSNPKPTPVKE